MYCTICKHENAAEMVEAWALGQSLRKVAAERKVGYRSLQRHLDLCLAELKCGSALIYRVEIKVTRGKKAFIRKKYSPTHSRELGLTGWEKYWSFGIYTGP
jgi:hypothetical protein